MGVTSMRREIMAANPGEKPPRPDRGGGRKLRCWDSSLDAITSLAIRASAGLDGQSPFLLQGGAEEAAYAMGLPLGDGHELFQCGAARPFQQFQNLGRCQLLGTHANDVVWGMNGQKISKTT
jgi:hypothetical protein